ncbi:MAG: hypothetical protein U0X20_24325 [Caldilineaceae bacterium]
MSANLPPNLPRVLLSHNELSVILNLLSVASIPGVGADPLGDLTAEQQAYGLMVAERGLRARELAVINDGGRLLVQQAVLELVGSCVLAEGTLVVTTIGATEGSGVQWFGHRLGETFVVHTLPDVVLHQFSQVPDRAALVRLIVDAAALPDTPDAPSLLLTQPAAIIAAVRELALQSSSAAVETLLASGADYDAAAAFVAVLANRHAVTIIQSVHRLAAEKAAISTVTLLYNSSDLWLMTELDGDTESAVFLLRPATRTQAEQLIAQLEW